MDEKIGIDVIFGDLRLMTGAACDSPDSAPSKSRKREAAKGIREGAQLDYRKGSASFDFVFSALLFTLILGFAALTYAEHIESYQIRQEKADLERSALEISQSLVKSRGYPADWEDDPPGVEILGLAEAENVLNSKKVAALESIPYNQTRELLGISGEYFMEIRASDGRLLFSKGSVNENASSASIERIVYFNQSFSSLVVRLYER